MLEVHFKESATIVVSMVIEQVTVLRKVEKVFRKKWAKNSMASVTTAVRLDIGKQIVGYWTKTRTKGLKAIKKKLIATNNK